ncbi:TerB family tellurite resistance protein [Allomuricauda sp. d1]|uniref:tellurite resistance TerB family protein n=1 Tax=Allomuricauda sp. d1 TaxID=3136725 RepID=UPI0031E27508
MDLYESDSHRNELAHFATLASLAAVDGEINPEEKAILDKFAFKLHITEAEYKEILKKENKYPIETQTSNEKRYRRLFDLFQIIFSDNHMDDSEKRLVERYAIGLGFPTETAAEIINKSVAIFTGKIPFEDYHTLMQK